MDPSVSPSPGRSRGLSRRTVLVTTVLVALIALAAVVVGRGPRTIAPSSPAPGSPAPGSPASLASVAPSLSVAPIGSPSFTVRASASAATPASSLSAFDARRVAVRLEPFVGGFQAPLAIVDAGDGSGRLFVAQQGGQVRIIDGGHLRAAAFLDIGGRITSGGERGLLGLAFHPRYPGDPRVFVDYTDLQGNTVVSSFSVDPGDPNRLDPASEAIVLRVQQPYPNHNGGALAFDRSGMLLIGLGDGGSGGDPQGNGQSLTTLLGKVLRIDVDRPSGGRAYGVPADNPYASGAAGSKPEIWLTGLRNPWRFSIDRATADLWIGDVGQNAWEEIDVQRAGAAGGTNFGWNRMEGTHCFQPAQGCAGPGLTPPVSDYGHDLGCTVIGGNVYRGTAQPALVGGYVFADYCSGRIWAIDPVGSAYRAPIEVGRSGANPSTFGQDEAGELYVADITAGAVLRLVATRR
ncbi:MAG: PQQ-dependent sugar dehydrogenase [Candidatus Limnocylindrales bacterium]